MATRQMKKGSRVLDERDQTGTIIRIERRQGHDVIAMVRFDYQRPSSDPKPKPLSSLKLVSVA